MYVPYAHHNKQINFRGNLLGKSFGAPDSQASTTGMRQLIATDKTVWMPDSNNVFSSLNDLLDIFEKVSFFLRSFTRYSTDIFDI